MPSRLSFSPGNHSYWLRDPATGKKTRTTSVTTLLNQLAKPALIKWAAREAGDYAADHWDALASMPPSKRAKEIAAAPDLVKNTKAAKGTAIHALAEGLLRGEPVEVPEELRPKVEGLARWWQAHPMAHVAAEAQVWSDPDEDLGLCAFAGTLDLLVDCPRRGRGLLDLKTGNGVYGEFGVQLAGYNSADWHVSNDTDVPWTPVAWAGVLHVRTDSTELHVLDAEQMRNGARLFELLRMLRTIDEPAFRQEAA